MKRLATSIFLLAASISSACAAQTPPPAGSPEGGLGAAVAPLPIKGDGDGASVQPPPLDLAQIGNSDGGAIVSLNDAYPAVGQTFRPTSDDPLQRFAFLIETYDDPVSVSAEILQWDEASRTGTPIWSSAPPVERTNRQLQMLAFETGGVQLDKGRPYLLLVHLKSETGKGAGIGAALPGPFEEGTLVRTGQDGSEILDQVDATFIAIFGRDHAEDVAVPPEHH